MIPNSVTTIDPWVFSGCTGLTSIVIPSSVTSIGAQAFSGCTSLTRVYFAGSAPEDYGAFDESPLVTVYYLPGTAGWESTFAGRPTALWTSPLLSAGSADVISNGFGFTISWAPNSTLVVEACTDLATRIWLPLTTNAPPSGSWDFRDPDGAKQPHRFYRVRSP